MSTSAGLGEAADRLPVAGPAAVRREAWRLLHAERRGLTWLTVLTCLASAVGLAGPYLLGRIVDLLEAGTATVDAVDGLAAAALACALAYLVLNRYAKLGAYRFGERALRRLREEFVDRVMALLTRVVERSGTGDGVLFAALDAVDAGWVRELPEGLDTLVGAGGTALDAARAQQLALARVVLADPHTVVLDEATSLLDPTTARDTERSLAAVLEGRTVIAVAHRLHTAHDADRVAVVEDGRIAELGTHDDLVGAGGPYSALWRSWRGEA